MLHQEMDAERRALITDQSTGAWNRQKIDRRMEELMKMNEPFCALLVSVRNFKRIEERYPRRVVEGALKAMVQRLRAIVGNDAAIGRWDEQRFLVILDLDQSAAMALPATRPRDFREPIRFRTAGSRKSWRSKRPPVCSIAARTPTMPHS